MARGRPKAEPCTCIYCGRPARYPVLGLCEAHRIRMKRGKDMTTPLRPPPVIEPWSRLTEAALAYAEADEGDDLDAAEKRLRFAAFAYVKAYREARQEAA